MGRYWNTESFDGKFGFGCQSSNDPEIFGMYEESVIHYEATEDEIPQCEEALQKQYDLLKIPLHERCWKVENREELDKAYDRYEGYAFEECVPDESKWCDIDKQGNVTHWKERFDGAALALYRIHLGLAILSELKENGQCFLDAEC